MTVTVKVTEIQEPELINKGKQKQQVNIADANGSARVILWEQDIGKLKVHQSYCLSRLIVRSYKGTTYLSFPSNGATINEVNDIGDGLDHESSADEENEAVTIVAVTNLQVQHTCLVCKATIKPASADSILASCDKCMTTQRLKQGKLLDCLLC